MHVLEKEYVKMFCVLLFGGAGVMEAGSELVRKIWRPT